MGNDQVNGGDLLVPKRGVREGLVVRERIGPVKIGRRGAAVRRLRAAGCQ